MPPINQITRIRAIQQYAICTPNSKNMRTADEFRRAVGLQTSIVLYVVLVHSCHLQQVQNNNELCMITDYIT